MIIIHGNPDIKEVALLFDDGPNPLVTPKLLKVLDEKMVPANFFLIGMRAEQSPQIAKKIAEAGHEIGNHAYTHKKLSETLKNQGEQAVIDEVVRAKVAISKTAGITEDQVKYFRPPYLDWNDDIEKIVSKIYGDNIILTKLAVSDWDWSTDHNWDANDYSAIADHAKIIVETWQQVVEPGSLLCFHDSSEHMLPGNKQYANWQNRALPTLEAAPKIIDFLINNGYEIKRLSDMTLVKE